MFRAIFTTCRVLQELCKHYKTKITLQHFPDRQCKKCVTKCLKAPTYNVVVVKFTFPNTVVTRGPYQPLVYFRNVN
jgi:hypothetical protein